MFSNARRNIKTTNKVVLATMRYLIRTNTPEELRNTDDIIRRLFNQYGGFVKVKQITTVRVSTLVVNILSFFGVNRYVDSRFLCFGFVFIVLIKEWRCK